MADFELFTAIALSLPGTISAPHFDRLAFKVKRIYASLPADGLSANIKFTPEEQEMKCLLAPEIFERIENAWGRQGWTHMALAPAGEDDVRAALTLAHAHGAALKP